MVKPPSLSVQSVVQWLVHGARNAPLSQEVLTELCERLTAAGLPLWRVTVFVRTLHPEIVGAGSLGILRPARWSPTAASNCSSAGLFSTVR